MAFSRDLARDRLGGSWLNIRRFADDMMIRMRKCEVLQTKAGRYTASAVSPGCAGRDFWARAKP